MWNARASANSGWNCYASRIGGLNFQVQHPDQCLVACGCSRLSSMAENTVIKHT